MRRLTTLIAFAALVLSWTSAAAQASPARLPLPPSAQQLQLTPAQASEWEALQADAIGLRQQLLSDVAHNLPALEQALAAPDADLELLVQHLQSQVLYALWQTQPIRDRRLAFYQSLNAQQQTLVRDWLIAVVQRLQRVIAAVQVLQAE